MKRISVTLLFCASLVFMGCKNEKREDDSRNATDAELNSDADRESEIDDSETKELVVEIMSRSDSNVSGEAVFTETNGEVTLNAEISGLPEGQVAMHLHEKADCSADDATSAGGHWNPTNERHGQWGDEEGHHKGDIGNINVDQDGNSSVSFATDEWCIGCDDDNKNIIGKALMIHNGVDDYTSQPSGDAGKRIGCGEINESNI